MTLLRKSTKLWHQKWESLCKHWIWTFLYEKKSYANNCEISTHANTCLYKALVRLQEEIQYCETIPHTTPASKPLETQAKSHVSSSSCYSITQSINVTNISVIVKGYFENPKFITHIIWPSFSNTHTKWSTAHIHLWKLYCSSPGDKGKNLSS